MRIRCLETFRITLPFRFAFSHSLASREESKNLIVKVTLDNGICGFGESIPRDYVTGETLAEAEDNVLLRYAPLALAMNFDDPGQFVKSLKQAFLSLSLHEKSQGASWCALELALLDALSRLHAMPLCDLLGQLKQKKIRYGGTVPFGKKNALKAILWFYKLYGFKTVKLKVGARDLQDDLAALQLARQILGKDCILRVDANCAWTLDQALKAVETFTPYNVSSYEQPLPAQDYTGLKKLSDAIAEDVVVDESLCTLKQARELAQDKICDAFNVRVSKAGGLLAGQEMIDIARSNGLRVHLGAQVGESGILSAAARHLALLNDPMENYEGSANFFLLKKDLCLESLNSGLSGFADLKYRRKTNGLGLNISERNLISMTESSSETQSEASSSIKSANAALSPKAR